MTGFEPGFYGIGSDKHSHIAAITELDSKMYYKLNWLNKNYRVFKTRFLKTAFYYFQRKCFLV